MICKAEDGHALKNSKDVLWNHFPHENDSEDNVENLEFALRFSLVSVKRLEQRRDRQIDRPKHLRRVHQDFSQKTSNTEADELRGDGNEDTSGMRGITSIEELLRSECLRR